MCSVKDSSRAVATEITLCVVVIRSCVPNDLLLLECGAHVDFSLIPKVSVIIEHHIVESRLKSKERMLEIAPDLSDRITAHHSAILLVAVLHLMLICYA